MSYDERKTVLKGCRYVSEVIPNVGGEDSKPTIIKTEPHIIAVGSDWAVKNYYKQMSFTQKWLDDRRILLVYLPYTKGISTTEIKKRIINR